MICSEFAYRCYDEALPVAHDPYSLDINPFLSAFPLDPPGMRFFSPKVVKKNFHRDSLLAWTEDFITNCSRSGSNILLRSFEKGAAKQVKKKLSAEEKKLSELPLNTLAKNYLEEAKKPTSRSRMLEASLRSPEILGKINKFGEALFRATKARKSKAFKVDGSLKGEAQVPEALENLFETAADFVTPGDLYGCKDLYTVGSITP